MAKITLTLVTLLIDRDASTKLPTTVPEYEQSILEEIYGEELVTELSSDEVQVENFDVGVAFAGLVKKYGGNADSDAARARYFNRERDLEKFIGDRQPKAGKSAPATAPAKTAAEKRAAKGATKAGKDAPAPDFTELLAGDVEAITSKLKDLSDADLVAIEAAETEGQAREDLLAAIDDESESRKQ
ncbi:hypothetical protein [Stenotrophomonas sp.]|uniref:hypothetical protein n=1 Tax=Stenotrophomonas sp. TaxID=69392 RepID=UPI0028A866D0|nr:hypothetical protein [Stenotrophomonas sp.]